MPKSLQETLKQLQILLGQPHKKIARVLKHYTSFLSLKENGENSADSSQKTENIQTLRYGKITWVDVKNPTRREISQLAQEYPFHPLHLEDCVSKGQIQKIEQNEEDKYLFLLLRFPHYNTQDKNININQICFFLGQNYLVSIHEAPIETISDIFTECKENIEQRKAYIGNSSAHLLYILISRLVSDMSNLLHMILTEVDETEDIVFDDKVSGVYKIGQLRRKILNARRVIGPMRTLVKEITSIINKFTSSNISVYFDDISNQVAKAWETLELARETVDIYKDADFTISAEKTNRILSVLTIIFTFSIPATVVGTFYGMNITLPGGIEAGSWTFLGDYSTFVVMFLSATIPAVFMYLYFRKRGWF